MAKAKRTRVSSDARLSRTEETTSERLASRAPPTDEELDAEEAILFPFREVALSSGRRALVREWDLTTGRRQVKRLLAMIEKAEASELNFAEMTTHHVVDWAWDEILAIVKDTVSLPDGDAFEEVVSFADALALAVATVDVCLVREGTGVLPQLAKLVEAGTLGFLSFAGATADPSPKPSTSS